MLNRPLEPGPTEQLRLLRDQILGSDPQVVERRAYGIWSRFSRTARRGGRRWRPSGDCHCCHDGRDDTPHSSEDRERWNHSLSCSGHKWAALSSTKMVGHSTCLHLFARTASVTAG